jgi:hypothetical protein
VPLTRRCESPKFHADVDVAYVFILSFSPLLPQGAIYFVTTIRRDAAKFHPFPLIKSFHPLGRDSIHASRSVWRHPIALSPIFTGRGNSPRRSIEYRALRLTPVKL